MIDLFDANWDADMLEAGFASSCRRMMLLVSNFVVDVASGVVEVLGLDWTSSSGKMSSNCCFLKVNWVRGDLRWFETVAEKC